MWTKFILVRKCFQTPAYFSSFDLKSSLNQKLSSLKAKVYFCDWQMNVSIFSNAATFPEQVTNATKIWTGYKVNLLLTRKKNKTPKFYFCIRAPTFSTHMPCPLKICFTSKVNTIFGGGQLLVTGSQGPITTVPGVRILCPRVPVPESQSLGSQSPRSQGPGSRVSGPDFGLCPEMMFFNLA